MKWITRERVKVDRVACPWLIKKFVDPEAEFLVEQLVATLKHADAGTPDTARERLADNSG